MDIRDAYVSERNQRKELEAHVIRLDDRIHLALDVLLSYGGTDGAHHKMWVIDQAVRNLADNYSQTIRDHCAGEDGPDTYGWDTGTPP